MVAIVSLVNIVRAKTATSLHEKVCEQLMFGHLDGSDVDWTYGTDVGLHNVVVGAESFDWEFDLKRLWLARSRWNTMVRQYLDPDAVAAWTNMITTRLTGRGRGIAVLRTNTVQGRGEGKNVRRRWGSCMLSYSFRSNPVPTFTMHSRTTYFGYLAAMDITVGHTLAQLAGALTGIAPEEMQFIWNIELVQFHGFRSLAWPLSDPEMKAQMDADVDDRKSFAIKGVRSQPGYRKALDGYSRLLASDRAGKLYGDEAFSSFCRVRRRFHAEVMGAKYAQQFSGGDLRGKAVKPFAALPHVDAWDLDLMPIGIEVP